MCVAYHRGWLRSGLSLCSFFFLLNIACILLHGEWIRVNNAPPLPLRRSFFLGWHEFENASICLRKISRTHLPKIVLIHRGINSSRTSHRHKRAANFRSIYLRFVMMAAFVFGSDLPPGWKRERRWDLKREIRRTRSLSTCQPIVTLHVQMQVWRLAVISEMLNAVLKWKSEWLSPNYSCTDCGIANRVMMLVELPTLIYHLFVCLIFFMQRFSRTYNIIERIFHFCGNFSVDHISGGSYDRR